MIGLTLLRSIKLAWQNFWRNRWLSLVTVLILILTLFLISLIGALKVVADKTLNSVQEKVDFSIYLSPKAAKNEVFSLRSDLEKMPEVQTVKYISPEEALSEFRKKHENNPAIIEALDALEENPLGAVIVVKAKLLDDYDSIAKLVQAERYQKIIQSNDNDFAANKELINKLSHITQNINHFGLVLIIIFAFISFLVIFNTIRITIHSYREEIGIMKLVGASNNFVRSPFIIESIFYGIFSSLVSLALLYSLINTIEPFLNNFFAGYNLNIVSYFNGHFWLVLIFLLLTSIFICSLSSAIAVRRYLKV